MTGSPGPALDLNNLNLRQLSSTRIYVIGGRRLTYFNLREVRLVKQQVTASMQTILVIENTAY